MIDRAARPVVLSLADLEAHDPRAPAHGTERRFLCPLPACRDKQAGSGHRSLAVNVDSGAWTCHRCTSSGILAEKRDAPGTRRPDARLRAAFELRPVRPPSPPPTPPGAIRTGIPLVGTPGEAYLRSRGIPADLIARVDATWSPDHFGRPAILFTVRDRAGLVVAAIGRYVDGRDDPKGRDMGKKSLGVFATPGARTTTGRLVITEAPIDALSLAAAGIPAIALGGTSWPAWLPGACTLRAVGLALDADTAGDTGAGGLARALALYTTQVERWRPSGAKDWNELLLTLGRDALADALTADADRNAEQLRSTWSALATRAEMMADAAVDAERAGHPERAAELAARGRALLDEAQAPYARWIDLRRAAGASWQAEARDALDALRRRR